MSTLGELQGAFRQAMLGDDPRAAAGLAALVRGDGLEPEARIRLYRHHVLTTLTAVLEATYPVVRRLVGPGFFAYAADAYVRREPPRSPALFEYGAGLSRFLADFGPTRDLVWLPDVARLEWAVHRARWTDDAVPLDPAQLRQVPPADLGRLVLQLDPSVTLLRSRWPIDRIWRANQPDADPDATVDLDAGGAELEVRRLDDDVVFRRLDPGPHAFRRALSEGRSLEAAAAAGLAAEPGLDLAAALRALLEDRVLAGLVLAPERPGPSTPPAPPGAPDSPESRASPASPAPKETRPWPRR